MNFQPPANDQPKDLRESHSDAEQAETEQSVVSSADLSTIAPPEEIMSHQTAQNTSEILSDMEVVLDESAKADASMNSSMEDQ